MAEILYTYIYIYIYKLSAIIYIYIYIYIYACVCDLFIILLSFPSFSVYSRLSTVLYQCNLPESWREYVCTESCSNCSRSNHLGAPQFFLFFYPILLIQLPRNVLFYFYLNGSVGIYLSSTSKHRIPDLFFFVVIIFSLKLSFCFYTNLFISLIFFFLHNF